MSDHGEKKKLCFVITPIGDESSDIRRHVDGIIEAAIKPVFENDFIVRAAHNINAPGNITKQIVQAIFQSDLVIANLTERNPNVMYELALRHCVGKPTIMICEQGTKLPSDIISERTNFYINDSKGVLELRQKLVSCMEEINFDPQNVESPIYTALREIGIDDSIIKRTEEENPKDVAVLSVILEKIGSLQTEIQRKNENYGSNISPSEVWKFVVDSEEIPQSVIPKLKEAITDMVNNYFSKYLRRSPKIAIIDKNHLSVELVLYDTGGEEQFLDIFCNGVENIFQKRGIKVSSISKSMYTFI